MNEVQNIANFHTCYLPYGLEFFHKGHPKHKLNYSWPQLQISLLAVYNMSYVKSRENTENYGKLPENSHFWSETLVFGYFLNTKINFKYVLK